MNNSAPMTTSRRRRRRRLLTFAAAAAAAVASAGILYGGNAEHEPDMPARTTTSTRRSGARELHQNEFDRNAPPPMLSSSDTGGKPRLRHLYQGGRLGNILFQWASTYAIAKANAMLPCIVENRDRSLPLHMYFEGHFPVCEGVHDADARKEPIWDGGIRAASKFYTEGDSTYYQRQGHTGEDISLHGFLESASNLADVEEDVVQMFTFREKYRLKAEEYLAPIREDGYIPVGIHVRREDKKKECCQPQYFQEAMDNVTNTLRDRGEKREIMFLVASQLPDGPDWYEEMKSLGVFPEDNSRYIGGHTVKDLSILTQCDHIILTHGTFSFFAGYLGAWQKDGGIVIQSKILEQISTGLPWTTIGGCLPDARL